MTNMPMLGDVTQMSGRPANGRSDLTEANPYEVDDGKEEASYAEEALGRQLRRQRLLCPPTRSVGKAGEGMILLSTAQYESPAPYYPPNYPPPYYGYLERPRPSGLRDVLELILDRGLVIDIFVRVSLVGIELLTIDARIVVASVDTYLKFAREVSRLELPRAEPRVPGATGQVIEGGTRSTTPAVSQGAEKQPGETPHSGGGQGEQVPTQPSRPEQES